LINPFPSTVTLLPIMQISAALLYAPLTTDWKKALPLVSPSSEKQTSCSKDRLY
jgi:hypothetical protein